MTEEGREAKAMVLLDYIESKQSLVLLRDSIEKIGDFLKTVGEDLKSDPSTYAYKGYTIMPQSKIDAMVKEWQELSEKTEKLKQKAASYGISI